MSTATQPKQHASLRSFLLPIYVYQFFDELIFIYSFYALMFAERGLGPMKISVLFAVWSITEFVLQIPAGALADKYSRKAILIFAELMKMCCLACWLFWPTFYGFLAGFMCWGVKGAFRDGAFEALVFDELKHYGAEADYARVIGRVGFLSTLGILIADLSAGWMIRFGYQAMIIASLGSLAVSCLALLLVRPADRAESTAEHGYFRLLKQGVREAAGNRNIRGLIVFMSFALIFFGTLDEYWTLLLREAGVSRPAIGPISAIATASCATAEVIAYRFTSLPLRTHYLAYLALAVLLFATIYPMCPAGIVCIGVLMAWSQVIHIAMETRVQESIAGDARATVMSVRGFLTETAAVQVYLGFGAMAHAWHYRGGFMVCAGLMLLIGLLYLAIDAKNARRL